MSPERANAALSGTTTVARKVYDAVPINEAWDLAAIRAELLRLRNSSIDMHTMRGCLGVLREAGLVIERDGRFTRCKVKARHEKEEATNVIEIKPQEPRKSVGTPLETLSGIASRLSAVARDLAAIASEIETEALRISSDLEAQDEDSAKLDQLRDGLRAVLKGIA